MKFLLLLILIFSTTSCQKKTTGIYSKEPVISKDNQEEIIKYQDDNPIKIGLYQNNKLVHNYKVSLSDHKDIGIFEIYYTNDETLSDNNQKRAWNNYYQKYSDISKYKIGFNISFKTINETIDYLVLDPSEMHHTDYLYYYLYDDIHQANNSWYSHLETQNINASTIYSSIKLYLANRTYEIVSPITLTVFTYDEDDFDENNHYRGNSSYTISIETK